MAHPLGLAPSKVIAVHLNYRSRSEQRGRTPSVPSYFLKPPSSIGADGAPVARPRGCELLAFEGELAVVIGTRARRVAPEEAGAHIGFYTAANDFGVHDFRWADRGSNLMAKGQDGYTPLGPRLVPAGELDARDLTLRTFVNGEVVQEDSTADLLFPIELLIADLSRFVTLEPGDVILTGTPANSRPVEPGDVVDVEIDGIGRLCSPIVEDDHELAPLGAMPRATAQARAAALGTAAPGVPQAAAGGESRLPAAAEGGLPVASGPPEAGPQAVSPASLSPAAADALRTVSTATLTVQLRNRGIRNTFMQGLRPTRPEMRLLGHAHTLRYVPLREDVLAADDAELNAQKTAVESIGPDEVLVIGARGEAGAGTIGDILALRALRRGATGIVTDGGLRDTPAVSALAIPTYYQAPHAAVLGLLHYPLESGVPISCGGVLVMPGDVIAGDAEGVVVVPAALAEEVARDALEQEEREAFALERVAAGESVRGVYPIADERRAEFEAWRARRAQREEVPT